MCQFCRAVKSLLKSKRSFTFGVMTELGYILKQDILANLHGETLDELTGGRKAIGSNPAVGGDDAIWKASAPTSVEKVKGYSRHWYDMATEARPFFEYSATEAFTEGQRVAGAEVDEERSLYDCIQDAPSGTALTDENFFKANDSRNPVLVELAAVLVIYNTARRTNPRQLPEQRILDYDNAISTLKDIQRGAIQLDITQREEVESDDPGHRVAYGDFENVPNYDY